MVRRLLISSPILLLMTALLRVVIRSGQISSMPIPYLPHLQITVASLKLWHWARTVLLLTRETIPHALPPISAEWCAHLESNVIWVHTNSLMLPHLQFLPSLEPTSTLPVQQVLISRLPFLSQWLA